MNMKHRRSEEDLLRAKKGELDSFNEFWDKEMDNFTK